MHLNLVLTIERQSKKPSDWRDNEHRVLVLGGLPGCDDCEGPWDTRDKKLVDDVRSDWIADNRGKHESLPDQMLDYFDELWSTGKYYFQFDYKTGDPGEPTALMKAVDVLYDSLVKKINRTRMVVSLYYSV